MKRIERQAGFTLVELMIGMVVLGVVLTGVVRMFTNTSQYHTAQEMMVDLTQDLRAVKHLMVQELREAGCDPEQVGNIGFQLGTNNNAIHFTRDIDNDDGDNFLEPDGKTDGPNENIRYVRTNDDCRGAVGPEMVAGNNNPGCLRRDSGGGRQAVLPGVTRFELQYFRNDTPVSSPFDVAKLEDIDTVRVLIDAEVAQPNKVSAQARTQQLDFRVLIRNG